METKIQNGPRLLDYLDFRAFLQDYVAHQKSHVRGFSLRSWTSKMGFASASFWSAVLKGKKNLGEDSRIKCASVLGLQGQEDAYFHWLVQFNQAKDMEGKNYCFRQLQKFRASRARIVGEGQYLFYSKWYYAAVWNYFGLGKGRMEFSKIAEAMIPRITETQVEESVKILLELGLLQRKANHCYETCEMHLTTEPEVSSLAVKNHILDLQRLAGELLDTVPPQDRQYNTLMFQVSAQGFATIKDRIRQFQEELRDILDRDEKEDRIYTLNMCLFPNSRPGA